jgi:hypothetical protein
VAFTSPIRRMSPRFLRLRNQRDDALPGARPRSTRGGACRPRHNHAAARKPDATNIGVIFSEHTRDPADVMPRPMRLWQVAEQCGEPERNVFNAAKIVASEAAA